MHLALSVLVVILSYVAAQDQAQYLVYPSPYQVPYANNVVVNPEDPRFLLSTTTTTSTSTSTVTCTKSTVTACRRKRRGLLYDGEEEEQFPIVPSAVKGVEPTQVSSRDARAADPQFLVMSPSFAYQPQSGFHSGSYHYRPVVPFYGVQPIGDQRLFFTQISSFLTSVLTVTSTATAFAITTSTSTPACSAAGPIAQCPNA